MLRCKIQTAPDLVALYGIRPGNGVGLFLQPEACTGFSVDNQWHNKFGRKVDHWPWNNTGHCYYYSTLRTVQHNAAYFLPWRRREQSTVWECELQTAQDGRADHAQSVARLGLSPDNELWNPTSRTTFTFLNGI